MTPFAWMLTLLGCAMAGAIFAFFDLQEFLNKNESMEELENLQTFKELVRRQMYVSLAQLLLLWGAFFFAFYAFLTSQLGSKEFGIGGGFVLVLYLLTRGVRGLRDQSRALPVADKGVEGLYTAISRVWQERHLPDF